MYKYHSYVDVTLPRLRGEKKGFQKVIYILRSNRTQIYVKPRVYWCKKSSYCPADIWWPLVPGDVSVLSMGAFHLALQSAIYCIATRVG